MLAQWNLHGAEPSPPAADAEQAAVSSGYSPYVERPFPRDVYFGDTHVHTAYSFDAGMIGNTLGPEAAYRFAKGEVVTASLGARARLRRPLDFLVVADHAESLGIAPLIAESSPLVLEDPVGRELHQLVASDDPVAAYRRFAQIRATTGRPPLHRDDIRAPMWARIVEAAERHNAPGRFTALIGYEYTAAPETNNLHRVVLFRDGAARVGDVLPFSSVESGDPEDLWAFLDRYERTTGGRAMAIPHNGNLSNGLMFDDADRSGAPIDADYAARRQRWEPLYEVTQIKGDGETHPLLSPDDEFADFWTWDRGNFGFAAKTPDMLSGEYARAALKRGLAIEAATGVNPFKFGMLGASDAHTSLATTREDNFFSKGTPAEPNAGQRRYDQAIIQSYPGRDVDVRVYAYESAAAGLAAVWARENTREAIFDAMMRREVYATTGTRIRLRVFAGFGFEPEDAHADDIAAVGYAGGVPMGGDLDAAPRGAAPRLLIHAMRDPDGASLDRVQVVKGWRDAAGTLHERVYDVAWSGQRIPGAEGSLLPVASSVRGARYDNAAGAAELKTVWRDPDFDANALAFYYVRVLEIPTPTWLAHDEAHYGDRIRVPDDATRVHQERAYSSPIWYGSKR